MSRLVAQILPTDRRFLFQNCGNPYYQRKQAQTNVTVAHKTVAHKLARACYHMMRQQVPFDAAKAFG